MIRCILGSTIIFISAAAVDHDRESESESESSNPCLLYLAESTIPGAGLGMFAGKDFNKGELVGRVGDPAFPTGTKQLTWRQFDVSILRSQQSQRVSLLSLVDQDWHNSPEGASVTRHNWDYHWPLGKQDHPCRKVNAIRGSHITPTGSKLRVSCPTVQDYAVSPFILLLSMFLNSLDKLESARYW